MSPSERPRPEPEELRIQDTIRLTADGLAKVLGDLEARVMTTVWRTGRPATARSLHESVVVDHPVAIHTVITVLNKLVDKGLLHREKRDEILHYEPTLSEDEFRTRASRRVMEGILAFGPDAVTASFVDVLADHDLDKLAELERLIRKRLEERDR